MIVPLVETVATSGSLDSHVNDVSLGRLDVSLSLNVTEYLIDSVSNISVLPSVKIATLVA